MKTLWLIASLGLHLAVGAQAPAQTQASAPALARQALRTQIAQERAEVEAQFKKDEAACYGRFAVTGCLLAVQKQRRGALDKLRRQEVEVNAAERPENAQRQLKLISEKTAPEKLAEDAAKRAQAEKDYNERQDKARQKAQSGKMPEARALQSPKPAGRTSAQEAQSELRFQQKLQEAQQRQQRLQADKPAGTVAKPLPSAP